MTPQHKDIHKYVTLQTVQLPELSMQSSIDIEPSLTLAAQGPSLDVDPRAVRLKLFRKAVHP